MTLATSDALPEGLDAPAREFIARPQLLLIGSERLEAADGRTFATLDPSSGHEIARIPLAGAREVDLAVAAAREAFSDGPWASLAPSARERLMHALADALAEHEGEVAQIESLDNGKPVKLALGVDVRGAIAHLRYFAGWPTKIEGNVLPVSAPRMLCYTRREPVGVCAQIVPWNFPLLMASWKIAPALAAGCTIVLKPAEQTPLSALRLGELASRSGFRRACSTSSPATAARAPRSSITPMSRRSPSPARRPSAARSVRRPDGRSSARRSSSAESRRM